MGVAFLLIILSLIVVISVVAVRAKPDTTQWHPNMRLHLNPVSLMDGSTTRAVFLMRRRDPSGNWQYRKMTAEEYWRYYPPKM
jgi:hypothetical protein